MNNIESTGYTIHFQENAYRVLNEFLESSSLSKFFILVDANTAAFCLPIFIEKLQSNIPFEVIKIKAGEAHKNMSTCLHVWETLTGLNADRKSVVVNLGGGMLTDLGGFAASTYKRGIKFVNVPTTLLSMVDASVGSKTGVDLGSLKNLIGLFSDPEMVIIDTAYLETLSKRELHSGIAEVIKYGLTYDKALWNELKGLQEFSKDKLKKIIHRSVAIKNEIVFKDPKENGVRKVLNYGHTIGHALESFYLEREDKPTLTHGEAIGVGMVLEGYLSHKLFNFPESELQLLKLKVIELFGQLNILKEDYLIILDLMKHDKKNNGTTINFVLLKNIEHFELDCNVPHELLIEALAYYHD